MVDGLTGITVVTFCSLIQEIKGNNSTIIATSNESYPKIVITISIILFAVILAAIISKAANSCHDRSIVDDNSSDISSNTRKIIRARLSLISLQRKARGASVGQKFFRLWSKKANNTLTNETSSSVEKSTVINVEEAKSKIVENKAVVSKLNALLSNKISHGEESQSYKDVEKNYQQNTKSSPIKSNPPSPNLSSKSSSPRPNSAKRQDSFVGPNVARSNSIQNSSPPLRKKRDVTSATAVSINLSINSKTKKSVTFQDQIEVNGGFSNSKAVETNGSYKTFSKSSDTNGANKSNLKKT